MTTEITTNLTERQKYAARIRTEMSGTVQAIIETGRILCEAKAKLKQGEWKLLVENDLPFTRQTAFKLMAITHDPRLADVTHVQHLPPHWGTLYQLSQLHDDEFERGLQEGTIRPDMKRSEVKKLHAVPGHLVGSEGESKGDAEPADPLATAVHVLRRLSEDLEEPRQALVRLLHDMRTQAVKMTENGLNDPARRKFLARIDRKIELLNTMELGAFQIEIGRFCQDTWDQIN